MVCNPMPLVCTMQATACLLPPSSPSPLLARPQGQLETLAQRGVVQLSGHEGPVTAADFFPDSTQLVSASGDSTLRLWAPGLGRCLATYRGHLWPVWAAAACPHGAYFASGGRDRTARLWATEHPWALRVFTGEGQGQ
jgi:WD40 repeat protein